MRHWCRGSRLAIPTARSFLPCGIPQNAAVGPHDILAAADRNWTEACSKDSIPDTWCFAQHRAHERAPNLCLAATCVLTRAAVSRTCHARGHEPEISLGEVTTSGAGSDRISAVPRACKPSWGQLHQTFRMPPRESVYANRHCHSCVQQGRTVCNARIGALPTVRRQNDQVDGHHVHCSH